MLILIQRPASAQCSTERGLLLCCVAAWLPNQLCRAEQSSPHHNTQYRSIIVFCAIFRFSQSIQFTLFSAPWKPEDQVKMSKIFNWEYFSFVTFDDAVAYKVSSDTNISLNVNYSSLHSMIQFWLPGSVGGASRDICPLHGLDAACEGTGRGGGEEGSNREKDQLWAGLPGSL